MASSEEESVPDDTATETSPPRVVTEGISPELDAGRFPIERLLGESVRVPARIFADGHDRIAAALRQRPATKEPWREIPMRAEPNDRWQAEFQGERLGRHEYAVEAWIDAFGSRQESLRKKVAARQEVAGELLEGARLVAEAARRAHGARAKRLKPWAALLAGAENPERRVKTVLAPEREDEAFAPEFFTSLYPCALCPSARNSALRNLALLRALPIEESVYELGYELNNRPTWARLPIRGILELPEATAA
jgi:hypothetical protein